MCPFRDPYGARDIHAMKLQRDEVVAGAPGSHLAVILA
jgi:hypothetical protein